MGPAEKVEGRELAKGNVVQHTRDRTQSRVLPVTGARRRTAGIFGCLRVTTRGRSPVREGRTPGSVRGGLGNRHPYRDRGPTVLNRRTMITGNFFVRW